MLPGMFPFPGGGADVKSLTFIGSHEDGTNATTYTFSSASLGAAAGDRRIILGVCATQSSEQNISSVTIGGVTATKVVETSGTRKVTILIAHVPSGTTGDIVVTYAGSGSARCGIGVWAATGLTSDTAVDSTTSTASPGSLALTTVVGGFVVAVAQNGEDVSGTTWTDATEQYDIAMETGAQRHTGASDLTTGTSLTITATYASSSTPRAAAAAW
jgi:hypothetical protein